MQKKQKITAKVIADACGVSQATVSYVINNKFGKKISEKTRCEILDTASKLGYVPNLTARCMRTNRAMSIGIVSGPNNINIGVNHVLNGIKSVADKQGYSLTLLNSEDTELKENDYLQYYYSGRIDGILFLFYDMSEATKERLRELNIPYLIVSDNGISGENITDNRAFEEAITFVAQYCNDKQFANIHFISLQYGDKIYSHKYNIFVNELSKLYPQACCKRAIFQAEGLENADLIEQFSDYLDKEDVQLLVTPNQRIGWLIQSCILKKNFVIPQKTKHICLASSHIFHLVYPTVTSIDAPLNDIGMFACEGLIKLLNGENFVQRKFSCVLKEGISTQ